MKDGRGTWLLIATLALLMLLGLVMLSHAQDYQSLSSQTVIEDVTLYRANGTAVQEAAAQIQMVIVGADSSLSQNQALGVRLIQNVWRFQAYRNAVALRAGRYDIWVIGPGRPDSLLADNIYLEGGLAAKDEADATAIQTDAVGAPEIAADAVGSSEIAASAVDNAELATNAVTGVKISSSTIDSTKIASGTIGSSRLKDNGIYSGKFAEVDLTVPRSLFVGEAGEPDQSVYAASWAPRFGYRGRVWIAADTVLVGADIAAAATRFRLYESGGSATDFLELVMPALSAVRSYVLWSEAPMNNGVLTTNSSGVMAMTSTPTLGTLTTAAGGDVTAGDDLIATDNVSGASFTINNGTTITKELRGSVSVTDHTGITRQGFSVPGLTTSFKCVPGPIGDRADGTASTPAVTWYLDAQTDSLVVSTDVLTITDKTVCYICWTQ